MTKDEMARVIGMTSKERAAWLRGRTNAHCRAIGIAPMYPEGRAAAAPARTLRTTTPPRAKAEAIPPPPSMKDAILAARVPLHERAKQTFEKQMQAARDRAPQGRTR